MRRKTNTKQKDRGTATGIYTRLNETQGFYAYFKVPRQLIFSLAKTLSFRSSTLGQGQINAIHTHTRPFKYR